MSSASARPRKNGRMDLTDADIAKITTPLWDRAKAEIAAGRIDDGVALYDEAVSRARELQYFYVNRLTALMSFIAEELGEEAVERALRATGERFIRGRRDTGVDWAELPASAHLEQTNGHERANQGETRYERKEQRQISANEEHADDRIDNAEQYGE